MRRLLVVLALLLTACPSGGEDADGDGYPAGEDCDDDNSDVHPGSSERCNAADDDCDGAVDEDVIDGVVGYADADSDGFGDPTSGAVACTLAFGRTLDATDCDDGRDDVHPGAAELCDAVDHDCDGDDTAGATDPIPYFADADSDTYGDPGTSESGCSAPEGYVDNDGDCDDTLPDVSPAGTELVCNGLDDDCDGTTDVDVVPTDHATIQAAVDALPDGSTVCLAAGTYTERIDLAGRQLSFVGATGPAQTLFEIGPDLPLFVADSWDETHEVIVGDVADLTFAGITVTGGAWTPVADVDGGFLYLGGGSVRFEDVVVSGLHPTLEGGADVEGLLVDADAGVVDVDGIEVSDVSFTFSSGGEDLTMVVSGGILNVDETGELHLDNAVVSGLGVATTEAPGSCYTYGAFARIRGGTLTGAGWSLTGGNFNQACSAQSYIEGGYLDARGVDSTLSDITITGAVVQISSSSSAYVEGALIRGSELTGTWTGLAVHDNVATTTNDQSSSYAEGSLRVTRSSLTLTHSSFRGNTVRAIATGSSMSGFAAGGALYASGPLDLSHIDFRGNTAHGDREGSGGAVTWREDDAFPGTSTSSQLIVAGNRAEGSRAEGGGLRLRGGEDHHALLYSDLVGNAAVSGTGVARGGGLYDQSNDDGGSVLVSGVGLVGNTVSATGGGDLEGEAVYLAHGAVPRTWTYNNVFGPAAVALFDGMDDPAGTGGNLSVDPLYTLASGDVALWDLTLGAGSQCIGAGPAGQQNADGTPADMGAYGGPDAAWP